MISCLFSKCRDATEKILKSVYKYLKFAEFTNSMKEHFINIFKYFKNQHK